MIDYENMSTGAKRIFECADLFGSGGKRENADFASQILRAAADQVVPDETGMGVYLSGSELQLFFQRREIRRQLLGIAAELEDSND